MGDVLYKQGSSLAPVYKRDGKSNFIVQSQVASGNSDFFSLPGGLTLRLIANSTDPFEIDVNAVRLTLTANVDLTVTDTAHNFIWIDDTGATGRSALPCVYSFTAPGAPATDQHWFDLGKNQMKRYNGAAFVAVARVFIGYVRADAAAINARYVCEPIGLDPYSRFWRFGDGSDGFLDITGTIPIQGTKRYTAVVVRGAGILNHSTSVNTLAVPYIYSQSIIACVGTAGVDLNGLGRAAGSGTTTTGGAGASGGLGGGGGGGGGGTSGGGAGGTYVPTFHFGAQAGGAAGTTLGGTGGLGPSSAMPGGLPPGSMWGCGAGGGGGGGDGAVAGGNGGAGGGSTNMFAPAIAIGASAVIRANGANGTAGSAAARGGGAGGGGGVVLLYSSNFFNDGTLSATGGTGGGAGGAGAGAGGNGGAGLAVRFAA